MHKQTKLFFFVRYGFALQVVPHGQLVAVAERFVSSVLHFSGGLRIVIMLPSHV